MKRLKGFTLIELLVVISIIALLLSILLPALKRVRAIAKSAVCKSNLKQICLATTLYAQDYDQEMFPFSHAAGQYWIHQIAIYFDDDKYQDIAKKLGPDETITDGVMQIAFCPCANKRPANVTGSFWWGTSTESWGFMRSEGSYGFNCWFLPKTPDIRYSVHDNQPGDFFMKFSEASGGTPLVGDSFWIGACPGQPSGIDEEVPNKEQLETGLRGGVSQDTARFCVNRHSMKMNMGFAGGHVETLEFSELWMVKWNKGYKAVYGVKVPK